MSLAVPAEVVSVSSTEVPILGIALIFMSMMWLPPGLSSRVPLAGMTKPPALGCMTMTPASFLTVSWTSTMPATGEEPPVMVTSLSVVLVSVPKTPVIDMSPACLLYTSRCV